MASREPDNLWSGAYKIPWHEPAFSRRMLREHLSQDHALASRPLVWIDRQVAWLHEQLLAGLSSRVLDLGCGPGLYGHRLASLGHTCLGIDFGPASIEYAQQHTPAGASATFVCGDLRTTPLAGPHDLAMMLYGEFNVFSPAEIADLVRRARASLGTGGQLAIEAHTPAAVERLGTAPPTEHEVAADVFSDEPHRCRAESCWYAPQQVAVQTFTVTEAGDSASRTYRSTTQAWSDEALHELLTTAGFAPPVRRDDWPCNTDDLVLWVAQPG